MPDVLALVSYITLGLSWARRLDFPPFPSLTTHCQVQRGRDLAMVLDQSPALDQNSSVEIISSANSAAVDFVFRPILPIQNYTTLVIHEHYCDYLL